MPQKLIVKSAQVEGLAKSLLLPRAHPLDCAVASLERVTAAAFGQRRKMLRQSLRALGVSAEQLLDTAGIAATARAEDVPVEGFVALARALSCARTSVP